MREIKFKAWDKDTNTMFDTSEVDILFNKGEIEVLTDTGCTYIPLNDFGILQYTGLKDKSGKEIYEGDIIKVIGKQWNNCNKEYIEKITEEIGEVVFFKHWEVALRIKEKDGTLYRPFLWIFEDEEDYEVEILGNIYENKDLI